MKKTAIILLSLFTVTGLKAEKPDSLKYWKTGGMGSLLFSQLSLTNWAAGGQNSISFNSFFNLFSNYKKEKTTWDNTFDIAYGITKQNGLPSRKADDRIELNSKYGQYAFKHWYYSGLLQLKSQMAYGYKYPNDSVRISSFMAPGYLSVAIGMDFKPSAKFTLFISPLTGKGTFVIDTFLSNKGLFGVDAGKKFRGEFGGFIKSMFKYEITKNITFQTKIDLFSNYLKEPQAIDVNWETMTAFKLGKYISANLNTLLIYDKDIMIKDENGIEKDRVQMKELFGLGFSYKF
ncbi:MAG TPA: DUF3078 domain-containing protein [Bacteroidia bacterium]|nr:DUF3078 domain-containing protein [Bacteroidia bacterium]HRS58776.1 DUF3078 domain-containing protein [Bacteroidia bacterium]HRU69032.1 DUF3078 domain-containing protein [Bacteroidia bacterium]